MNERTVITTSADETKELGKRYASRMHAGEVLALYGDLGSGKTTFVQGLAVGLGITAKMQSPTFVLLRSHTLPTPVHNIEQVVHCDLYRLESSQEIASTGISDAFADPHALVIIEWADKIKNGLPEHTKKIMFTYLDDNRREIVFNHDE